MKKIIIIIFVLLLLTIIINSLEYKLTEGEIKKFLSLAENYIYLSNGFIEKGVYNSLYDLFYCENEEFLLKSIDFFEKNNWSYENMNDFLYTVYTALDAINYYEEYGNRGSKEYDKKLDPYKDINDSVLKLVENNKSSLREYFPVNDLLNELDLDDFNEIDTNINTDDFKGKYDLEIIGDRHYGYGNYIKIDSITGKVVSGEVAINWGIGAEARMPMEWEQMYIVPFTGKQNNSKISFSVIIGENFPPESSYEFKLLIGKPLKGFVLIPSGKEYSKYELKLNKK